MNPVRSKIQLQNASVTAPPRLYMQNTGHFNIYRPCAQSFASYTAQLLKIVSIYRPETQYFSNSFRPISQKLLNLQAKKQQNSGSMR